MIDETIDIEEYARLKSAEIHNVRLIYEYQRRISQLEMELGRRKKLKEWRRRLMTPNQERALLYIMITGMIIFWLYLVLTWK